MFTPSSLSSGLKTDNGKHAGEKLLEQLDGKRLVTFDMSQLIGERNDNRRKIFSQLRSAYDGDVVVAYGSTAGLVEQHNFRFDWIVAATPAIERARSFEADLGERFMDIRLGVNRHQAVRRAVEAEILGQTGEMREEIAQAVCQLIDNCEAAVVESPKYWEQIASLADATAILRTAVPRNGGHGVIAVPEPEIGGRLAKMLIKLSKGMAMLRQKPIPDERDYNALLRVAVDSIPSVRIHVLKQILRGNTANQQIEKATGLGCSKVSEIVIDLRLLGVTGKDNLLTDKWQEVMNDTRLGLALTRPQGYSVGAWASIVEAEKQIPETVS